MRTGAITRAAVFIFTIFVSMTACSEGDSIPQCERDAMLVGRGNFDEADRRWDRYDCGPSTFDLATFEEVQRLKAIVERIADCPEVRRGPSGDVALFYDGIKTYAELANGDPISLQDLARRCV